MCFIDLNLQLSFLSFPLEVHLVVLALIERKPIVWLALFRLERSLAETLYRALGEFWVEVGHV